MTVTSPLSCPKSGGETQFLISNFNEVIRGLDP